jgi:transposase
LAGRPTKLTAEVETDLVLLLANGLSIRSAARVVGVSRRSLTRWLADGLTERVAEARASRPETTDALTEARLVVAIARAAALGDWRARAWFLERRWPERWGASHYDPSA